MRIEKDIHPNCSEWDNQLGETEIKIRTSKHSLIINTGRCSVEDLESIINMIKNGETPYIDEDTEGGECSRESYVLDLLELAKLVVEGKVSDDATEIIQRMLFNGEIEITDLDDADVMAEKILPELI